MARRHPRKATAVDELTDEIRNRQGNVIWPGPLVNGMLVDRLAWKGSPGATALQRVRLIIFGLSFSLVGLVCVCQLDLAPFDALIWPHLVIVWIPDDGDQDSETMSIKITK
jgi:hypothetical protein